MSAPKKWSEAGIIETFVARCALYLMSRRYGVKAPFWTTPKEMSGRLLEKQFERALDALEPIGAAPPEKKPGTFTTAAVLDAIDKATSKTKKGGLN